MYGMINRVIQDYFMRELDEDGWNEIRSRVPGAESEFVTFEQYPDEMSVALIVAGADVSQRELGAVLEGVGEYFIEYAAAAGYESFLTALGTDVPKILSGLDNMHTRLGMSFTQIQAPSFWCTDVEDGSLTLHYRSERDGLEPLVVGILRGVGKRISKKIVAEKVEDSTIDHSIFHVTFSDENRA
ncbi:heme NO-binding domain-containing protein [bacterium]|nr:heme NO-binding domain-containing protein [bacterium]